MQTVTAYRVQRILTNVCSKKVNTSFTRENFKAAVCMDFPPKRLPSASQSPRSQDMTGIKM